MTIKLTRPLAGIDLETTGVDSEIDRIVEIAVVKLMPDGTRAGKVRRLNPGMPIPPEASAIHGITDADVAGEPTFPQVAKSLAEYLSGCDVAGYNARSFDVPMLRAAFAREGIDWPAADVRVVDPFEIFRRFEAHSLDRALAFYCDRQLGDAAHGAEADVNAALDVLEAQARYYRGDAPPSLADVDAMSRDPDWIDSTGKLRWQGDVPVVNFGKHKDAAVARVPASYWDWVLEQDFPADFVALVEDVVAGRFPQRRGAA